MELKENNPGLDNIFIDKKSEKQFPLFKYFDYEVIQDVETGWINAGGFVRDVGNLLGKNVDLYDFKTNEDYQFCIEYMKGYTYPEILVNMKDEVSYYLNKGFGRKLKGSYVPFRVFQLIALWADKKHKMEVLKPLRTIKIKTIFNQTLLIFSSLVVQRPLVYHIHLQLSFQLCSEIHNVLLNPYIFQPKAIDKPTSRSTINLDVHP